MSAKNGWFAFTYYDGDTPTKIKFKTPKDENGKNRLMQSRDSKPWIYKYNDLVDQKEVMICEGEEEALIWEVAGFKQASSVDMGAPNKSDKTVDAKLQCITNCFDVFENAEYDDIDDSLIVVDLGNDNRHAVPAHAFKIIKPMPDWLVQILFLAGLTVIGYVLILIQT